MRRPRLVEDHKICPKEWRHTPNLSGDYDMDASIMHCRNKDVPHRLKLYLKQDRGYGPLNNYHGYKTYGGDE